MATPPASLGPLHEADRRLLDAGEHEALARRLAEQGRHGLAGWVREQIWDFAGALADYRAAGLRVDALRMALEADAPAALDAVLAELPAADDEEFEAALALLRSRRRDMEVARLLAGR
ncbi:MAG: hypothetical protein AB1Z98_26955, partial [Nannocystaceae bacterium]